MNPLIKWNTTHIKCHRCGDIPEWIKGKTLKYCPACHFIAFAEQNCCHVKGKWKGIGFQFIPWQLNNVIIPAYGTIKPNGNRQYRTIYVEVPKKSGKTELGSVVALYGLVGDGEPSPEVYSAAGDIGQAALVYEPAKYMAEHGRHLKGRLDVLDSRKRIIDYKGNGFYQVLSSKSFTKHGLNPSTIAFDELHAQPNDRLWKVLTIDTDVAREQQIVLVMTTAGIYDKNSIGWKIHDYAMRVTKGIIKDPGFLPIIYGADKEKDDWEDPKVWKRVNPSLNHIFDMGKIKALYRQVKNNPDDVNEFMRFRLNMWVGQARRYIPMDKWDASQVEIDKGKLLKRTCYGALDLASTDDLTAFVLLFPPEEPSGRWLILPQFWVPEDNMLDRAKKDGVPYPIWVEAGLITATPGNATDYAFVRHEVVNAANLYDLREVAYDPWGSSKLAPELEGEDGIPMVQHRQGYASMSGPTKEFLRWLLLGKLGHNGNPVLRWNADNVAVMQDPAGNVKPAKDKSAEKIDGIVALIMALSAACRNADPKSIYESRGVIAL